jgi:hypothetical protein
VDQPSSLALNLSEPQNLNAYNYARANPVRFADPDGNDPRDSQPSLGKAGVKARIVKFFKKEGALYNPPPEQRSYYEYPEHLEMYGADRSTAPVVHTEIKRRGIGGSVEGSLEVTSGFKAKAEGSLYSATETGEHGGYTRVDFGQVSGELALLDPTKIVAAKVGFNLVGVSAQSDKHCLGTLCVSFEGALGLKAEAGVSVGKKTKIDLPLISFGITVSDKNEGNPNEVKPP